MLNIFYRCISATILDSDLETWNIYRETKGTQDTESWKNTLDMLNW